MSTTSEPVPAAAPELLGEAAPSPAGPAPDDGRPTSIPPGLPLAKGVQSMRFAVRQIEFVFRARRQIGETFTLHSVIDDPVIVCSHPDHVRSLFTAKPEDAPSLTGESPLRPIVGRHSVLTTLGEQHMRQRKLLLPPFHGEAVERYASMIAEAAEREIDRWPVGEAFALVPRMQAITLDVIMSGIFGVEGKPAAGTPEHGLRQAVRRLTDLSSRSAGQLVHLFTFGRTEPVGPVKAVVAYLDRHIYAVIAAARASEAEHSERTDILALMLRARDDDGQPMTDEELRDELVTLVLAGHETTANSLAWTFERLVRFPDAYARLREAVRAGEEPAASAWVEATIHEGMRVRPVVPIVARRVQREWQMGDYRLPAGTPVLVSILLVHHREDVYPEPFAFRPERFLGRKPGTYTWIPFGGGIRRCLGAALAMAEQRVVLRAIAERTDLQAAEPAPEKARHRNVTMIPAKGARVVVTSKR